MLLHMAVSTEGHEVLQAVVALVTPQDLVVKLEVFEGPALLTPPAMPLQDLLHQPPINLLSQLDPFHLLQYFATGSGFPFSRGQAVRP